MLWLGVKPITHLRTRIVLVLFGKPIVRVEGYSMVLIHLVALGDC